MCLYVSQGYWNFQLPSQTTRDRPHKCQVPGCNKAYRYSQDLRAHETAKHGRKPKRIFHKTYSENPTFTPEQPRNDRLCDANNLQLADTNLAEPVRDDDTQCVMVSERTDTIAHLTHIEDSVNQDDQS